MKKQSDPTELLTIKILFLTNFSCLQTFTLLQNLRNINLSFKHLNIKLHTLNYFLMIYSFVIFIIIS